MKIFYNTFIMTLLMDIKVILNYIKKQKIIDPKITQKIENDTMLTKETKHVKLMCSRCKELVYIDYKKDLIRILYCNNCLEPDNDFWDVRYARIEYK